MNLRNRLVFGSASYLADGVIKAKPYKNRPWEKECYVALVTGLDQTHGLARKFVQKVVEVGDSGKPIMTWTIPIGYKGIIEFGWAYGELSDEFASTFYIMCLGDGKYIEITEAQCYREQKMALIKAKEEAQ
jgi:hypothetical protein